MISLRTLTNSFLLFSSGMVTLAGILIVFLK